MEDNNFEKYNGLFDDDGNPINPNLINTPSLCLTCVNNDDPYEEVLCNLLRYGQRNEDTFICHAYKKKSMI